MRPMLVTDAVKVNTPFCFQRKPVLDILQYVQIQATLLYKEVVPKLFKFINLGHFIDIKL